MGTAPASCISQINSIQRKALRILADAKYNEPIEEAYKKMHILKVEDIFKLQACVYGWKFINKQLPKEIDKLMKPGNERSLQIQHNKFNILSLKQLSPIDFITREWNKLPIIIRESPTINTLKKALCSHYIEKYLKSCKKKTAAKDWSHLIEHSSH